MSSLYLFTESDSRTGCCYEFILRDLRAIFRFLESEVYMRRTIPAVSYILEASMEWFKERIAFMYGKDKKCFLETVYSLCSIKERHSRSGRQAHCWCFLDI